MTKITIYASLMLALATGSTTAAAEITGPSKLAVKGTITVPGCQVQGANPDGDVEYHYGALGSALIPATGDKPLDPQTKTWTVTCDALTYLTFGAVDVEHDSASLGGDTNFGLGNINGNGKIGYYTVYMTNPKVDAGDGKGLQRAYLFIGKPNDSNGVGQDAKYMAHGFSHGWVTSAAGTGVTPSPLMAGKVFVVDMTVQPYLASSAVMGGPVNSDVNLKGKVVISYSFGL
ncbi:hypothetical protein SAMN05216570_3769 [Dyella sp. OK004]|uniref:hypothetical protein n=1 Tax=Dyella sp. OK004 TaxID=1855292 RepID=UPI0008E73C49|nr:hypothetical protein [Dyella sp. OK004]SFS18604.1 hypothetical protein SAMN05216570_3769 [Dyella sp. OK004]